MRSQREATATAHANIALIKYWGKADEELIIPRASSLSLTLDDLLTTTTVRFLSDEPTATDRASLDGKTVTGRPLERITALLDLVRERAGIIAAAEVISSNRVPTAAGLASSASGFAALAGAAAAAAGLDLSDRELSRLARRGSGSASRSIFGGLAMWHAGDSDESSFAEPVEGSDQDGDFASEVSLIVLVLNAGPKAVSSREAMRRTVETSPLYKPWLVEHSAQLRDALDAIAARDLVRLGEAAEANALGMHAAMRASTPSIDYLSEASHAALRAVRDARAAGFPAWATMDAGPNVKVLTSAERAEELQTWLEKSLEDLVPELRTIVTHAGPGLQVTR